jgi:hypothetical protein
MIVNIFPLLDNKKTIPYLILLLIWNFSILLSFASTFFINSHPIIFRIFLSIFIVSFLIWIIGNLLVKKRKIIGTIEISNDFIKVNNNDLSCYYLNRIESLILSYGGAKGDSYGPYLGLLRINDGSNNTISIKYNGISLKFHFLVTRKLFLNSLTSVFNKWEQDGLNFKIIDSNKLDITKKFLNRSNSDFTHFQKKK